MLRIGPITNNEAAELRELRRSPKLRRERQQFIVEGAHLVEAALEFAPSDVLEVIATETAAERYTDILAGVRVRHITQKNAERIGETTTTQSIFALMKMPASGKNTDAAIILALDDIQDPGNVGTIVRTAAWFGVYDFIVTTSSADLYSQKTLRATQGTIFTVRSTVTTDLASALSMLKQNGYAIVATSLDENATPLAGFTSPARTVLVLGSEAHGVRPEVIAVADERISIPKIGTGESLNVAISCGIILEKLTAA